VRAYGQDRLREEADGTLLLSCRRPKPGWQEQKPRTPTSAEFPGTTVLWEEQYYEVVEIDSLPQGGVRYRLLPWRDEHAIRTIERYDGEMEAHRLGEHSRGISRVRKRKTANLVGMFTGHLPALVQEELGSELGVLPARLTLLSLIPPFGIVSFTVMFIVDRIQSNLSVPVWTIVVLIYLGFEMAIRFLVVWTQSRPIGSTAGFAAYLVWYLLNPNRRKSVSPFAEAKGSGILKTEPSAEQAAKDAFAVREPLVTLLTPQEQARAAERYGYDYRRLARKVSLLLLVVGVVGVVSSAMSLSEGFRLSALLALLTGGAIAVEQLVRLPALRQRPAGSFLAFVVRPLTRKLVG